MPYLNHDSKGQRLPAMKADALIKDGAVEIEAPTTYTQGGDLDLVVVADNGSFEAALYITELRDWERVQFDKQCGDPRTYRWLRYRHAARIAEQHPSEG